MDQSQSGESFEEDDEVGLSTGKMVRLIVYRCTIKLSRTFISLCPGWPPVLCCPRRTVCHHWLDGFVSAREPSCTVSSSGGGANCNIEAWVGVKDGVSLSVLLLNLKAQHRNTTQRMYMKTTINQSRGRCNQSIFKHGQGRDILTTRPFCNVCLQSANLKSETQ